MSGPLITAQLRKWTRATTLAFFFGLFVLVAGQLARIRLGQEFWILGNGLSAASIWVGSVTILFALSSIYSRSRTSLVVFPSGVEVTTGVFRRRNERLEASQIESVTTAQSTMGGESYGTVKVTGTGRAEIAVDSVANFLQVAQKVSEISAAGSTNDSSERSIEEKDSPAARTSPSDEIEKLAGLRDRGVLSQAEFDTAKKRLLEADQV